MSERLIIRPPEPDEAAALARLHLITWEEAYSGLLPARFWNDEAFEQRLRMWTHITGDPATRQRARVAELDGKLIGLSLVGSPQDKDIATELYLIYLLAEHQGCGAASEMLNQLLGDEPASLWVFKENPRAQAFYRKHGFVPDGAETDLGEEENDAALNGVLEIRMVRGHA